MSVVWGSIADWVAAIGAAGALVYAVRLSGRDTRAQRRRQAESVAVWSDTAGLHQTVHVLNGSELPITDLQLPGWRHDDDGNEVESAEYHGALGPNGSVELEQWGGDPMFGRYRIEVEFRDANGRRWRRGIDGQLEEIQRARRWTRRR